MADLIGAINQTIRPVLAYAFALGILAGFFEGRIGTDSFMTIAGGVVGYFFGAARDEKRSTDPTTPAGVK